MRIEYPRVLLGALVCAVLVGVVVAGFTSGTAFGAYNPAWDGASELRAVAESEGAEPQILLNTSAYALTGDDTVALVLSPETGYNESERARIRGFVRRGGTLVVAEDFGPHGSALLRSVGATARVNGTLLRDERTHYRAPELPLAEPVDEPMNRSLVEPYTEGVDELTLNYGTAVEPGNATVVARASGFAYLDANANGQPDDAEPLRAYPVVTAESVGEGRVIVVSDPSLFINAMLDREGNRAFAGNVLAADRVLLDYSHAGSQPPFAALLLRVRANALLQAGVVALLVGAVVGAGRLRSIPARVVRLTTGVWGMRPQRGTDD
ncbi:DUF4350 domain-containing protein [Natronomonas sp. EA1]|uniref:DUF4350 domain-containing protein n=1 Tax=Natronomonas sp. EA1 TaxID=3421655 RepID=UPI003EBCDEF8